MTVHHEEARASAGSPLQRGDITVGGRTRDRTTPWDLLRSNGYVIFDRLLSEGTVTRMSAELEPWFAATPMCQGDFYGWHTTRFGSVLLKSQTSHQLVMHPLM